MIKIFLRVLLGLFFLVAGFGHFWKPASYVAIMPPYIPFPEAMVWVSGVCEMGLGFGVLIPSIARWSAWGLILLLIAVFPANLHMALHPELFPTIHAWALWVRLPFQGIFIAWAWWFTR